MEPVALKAGGEGADSDKCSICLSLFEKQAVASLENCQHVFCLHCILQWSQVNLTSVFIYYCSDICHKFC